MDLFKQINHAVLDLQSAHLQGFDRPLKALARLLDHEDLQSLNAGLTHGLSVETFLANATGEGGMVGSARLNWPDNEVERLGYCLLLIRWFAANPDNIINFGHTYFYSGSKIIASVQAVTAQLIVPFVRDFRAFVEGQGQVKPRLTPILSKRIFIVHGHDEGAREMVARFLEKLGFEAVILHEQANMGRTVIEKVEANSDVSFAVVLLTPDDEGCVRGGTPSARARQNVLLELGYFIGALGRERVCALKRGEVDIPSDFAGVVWESMDERGGWKLALGRELKAIGHQVDLNRLQE